jgi:uncharacterized protein (UPF0212 family)
MKCPHCGKEISHVFVYSQCVQRGYLKGDTVIEYNETDVLETLNIECPECTASLMGVVKEQ